MAETDDAGTWRAGVPVRVGAVAVLPIERVVVHAVESGGIGWVSAALEPAGVVVRDTSGLRVLGVGAATPSLAQLRARIAGLDEVLAAL